MKNAYICLIGLPKLVATAPGSSLSITVENWIGPMTTSGRGVTLPWNSASMTIGKEGCEVLVGVSDAAGVSVRTKAGAASVAASDGSGFAAISGVGVSIEG